MSNVEASFLIIIHLYVNKQVLNRITYQLQEYKYNILTITTKVLHIIKYKYCGNIFLQY